MNCRWRSAPPARCCSTCATRRNRRCRTSARCGSRSAPTASALDAATRRNLELDPACRATRPRRCSRCSTAASPRWARARCGAGSTGRSARSRCCASATRRSAHWPTRARYEALREQLARHRRPGAHPGARRAALGAPARSGAAARLAGGDARRCARALAAFDSPLLATLQRQHRRARRRSTRCCSARLRPSPRSCCATAASSPPATTRSSTSCALIAEQHRRLPARAGAARARAQRHRQSEAGLQPRAGLLHRGLARAGRARAGRLPAPPDRQERRALHHPGAQELRGQGARRARARAGAREGAVRAAADAR